MTTLHSEPYPRDVAILTCQKWCILRGLTRKEIKIIDTGDKVEVRSRHNERVHDGSKQARGSGLA